jgi:hypothetical protein
VGSLAVGAGLAEKVAMADLISEAMTGPNSLRMAGKAEEPEVVRMRILGHWMNIPWEGMRRWSLDRKNWMSGR